MKGIPVKFITTERGYCIVAIFTFSSHYPCNDKSWEMCNRFRFASQTRALSSLYVNGLPLKESVKTNLSWRGFHQDSNCWRPIIGSILHSTHFHTPVAQSALKVCGWVCRSSRAKGIDFYPVLERALPKMRGWQTGLHTIMTIMLPKRSLTRPIWRV